jgi:hypothetical protein
MTTGNFTGIEPSETPSQPVSKRSFRWPADYYAAPLAEVRPVFPKWVPYGCGTAAVAFFLLLIGAGIALSGERLKGFLDLMIGMTLGQMKPMYQPDITEMQKAAFDREVEAMREKLRTSKISVQHVQPFFQQMQKAVGDEKVTADELEKLTEAATKAGEKK